MVQHDAKPQRKMHRTVEEGDTRHEVSIAYLAVKGKKPRTADRRRTGRPQWRYFVKFEKGGWQIWQG